MTPDEHEWRPKAIDIWVGVFAAALVHQWAEQAKHQGTSSAADDADLFVDEAKYVADRALEAYQRSLEE